jgi:hypothetical protein
LFKSRRFWIGIAFSLLFLVLFLYRVDFRKMGEALGTANYLFILPGLALYFIALLFRTVRWRFLLSPIRPFGVGRLFPVVVIGYMANNLLPVRLGELVRAYYLGEREKVSVSASLATIFLERIYDGLTLLFFVAVAALFLPLAGLVKGLGQASGIPWTLLAVATALPFLVAMAYLTLLATFPRLRVTVDWLAALLPGRLRPRARELIGLFIQGLASLKSPRNLVFLFLLSVPVWFFEGAMYLVIGYSFGLPGSFIGFGQLVGVMLLVTAVSNLVLSLPSSQGGVGPFEFFGAATLVLLGMNSEVAKAYIVALHIALLVPVTLLGLLLLWWENISLAQLARPRRPEVASSFSREEG